MGDYLRDTRNYFLSIDKQQLKELNDDLQEISREANESISSSNEKTQIKYVLRYDGIGIERKAYSEISRCFDQAKHVERVIFELTTAQDYLPKGKKILAAFDRSNPDNCFLSVTDDDEHWVDTTFRKLESRIHQFKNHNGIVHKQIANLLIQLGGVCSGLFICLILAKLLSPYLHVQHSFFILFIGIFLIFSNMWIYFYSIIAKARNRFWPFVSFKKKPPGIIWQAIIAGVIGLIILGLAKLSWHFIKTIGSIALK